MLRDHLRTATAALHAQVEASLDILSPGIDAPAYRRYLERMWGFHAPLERALAGVDGLSLLPIDLDERWKVPHLEADLNELGGSAANLDTLDETSGRGLTSLLRDVDGALGCLYVLEGATLGGQIIHRELSQRMPDVLHRASRYLRCYGDDTGARWRVFCAALDARDDPQGMARTIAAAQETFRTLLTWWPADADVPS